MSLTFKEFLKETPLNDYQTIGDWSKGSSFRDKRDRMILQHPKSIERTRKKFGNTNYDFDFYFVNSAKANRHTEVGVVPPEWVKDNLGDEVYNAIEKNLGQDHIQVIFTNNKGSERVPLTAWMMAHRLGHALNAKGRDGKSHASYYYKQGHDHLISQFSSIMELYGKNNMPNSDDAMTKSAWTEGENRNGRGNFNSGRVSQLTMIHFFQMVCTFKSARDHNLRDWFEVMNELIAQHLTTGSIKFNKAPQVFGGKNKYRTQNVDEVNEHLEMLARDMQQTIDDILSTAVNSVLVM